jgi:hypothetical protein
MHISKAEYFQKTYSEEDCLSGITTSSINDFSVGTPCIAIVRPFVERESPKVAPNRPHYGSGYAGKKYGDSKTPMSKPKKAESKIKAIELYKMDVDKANLIIRNSLSEAMIIFMHNTRFGDKDFNIKDTHVSSFYFNGIRPLIYDDCLRVEASSFYDIHDPDEMKSIGDIVLDQLKNYRYINYTVADVAKSNAKTIISELLHMTNMIKGKMPHRTCLFHSKNNRSIIDTVSVSFYRLSDSIAIFDSSRAVGMCMEVFLSSSAVRDVTYPNKTMCWRFLFCKHRDNAFSVDGEEIKRPEAISVSNGFAGISEGLLTHVANDGAAKKKLKTAKVSRGG